MTMKLWVLLALFGLAMPCLGEIVNPSVSHPGDGCPDYNLDHTVSATLDVDQKTLTKNFPNPLDDPEDVAFHLFGQHYWRLEENSADPLVVKVFLTNGGFNVLKICKFQSQMGVQIEILDNKEAHFQHHNLTGTIITWKFIPESWYGSRVVLNVGFSMGALVEDKEHAENVIWSYVRSAIQSAQAKYGAYPCDYEYQSSSGFCNNVGHHALGATNQPMRRLYYKDPDPRWLAERDGVPVDSTRPSARKISNNLLNQFKNTPTSSGVNMLWVSFGQFIDHDIAITPFHGPKSPLNKPFNIPVKSDDHHFFLKANEANCKDTSAYDGSFKGKHSDEKESAPVCEYPSITFFRSEKYLNKGTPVKPFTQYNGQTAFLDLSQVYGNTAAKIKFLRSFENGMLKTGEAESLPYNGIEGVGIDLIIEGEDESSSRAGGDERCNEQPYLTMMHTLWLREHNRVAYELHELFPYWSDERLFQEARKITIAEYQAIVFKEWLPFLLGFDALGPYQGYQACVDPSISVFFATCAFRFGHSMVTDELKVADYYLRDHFSVPIEKTLFNHELWDKYEVNTDSLFLGAYKLIAEENDAQVQNALRNHLFTHFKEGTSPGYDLPAANIQRCRDHACPSWSDARKNFKLPVPHSWKNLPEMLQTPRDTYKVIKTYGAQNLYNLDAFPLGLMESKVPGALVGSLFHRAIGDQFWRMREGDRFYYENIHVNCDTKSRYPRIKQILEGKVSIKDIFLRNFDRRTDYVLHQKLDKLLPANLFLSPEHNICSPPLPILLPSSDQLQGCPGGYERVQRFFWDYETRKAVGVNICNIDNSLVNYLKGFASPNEAIQKCSNKNQFQARAYN